MTPLPPPLGKGELVAWRMDHKKHAATWDSGEGAFQVGGRWNARGRHHVVYCALDPATAIIEVAVHKGFAILDTVPHVLTSLAIDPATVPDIHVVQAADIPNPNWLAPGVPSIGQQKFGDALLGKHRFVLIPSVVSRHSWNLIFDGNAAQGLYSKGIQEDFALDTRLHRAP